MQPIYTTRTDYSVYQYAYRRRANTAALLSKNLSFPPFLFSTLGDSWSEGITGD